MIRRSPTILLDAAHNPHGAQATAAALEDSFAFSPLIGVIGVMADKDHEGVLAAFEPHLAHVVCTQNSTAAGDVGRARSPTAAREIFGEDRVSVVPRLVDAIDQAAALAEEGEAFGDAARLRGGAGHRLGGHGRRGPGPAAEAARVSEQPSDAATRSPRRGMCAAVLSLEAVALGLTTPVLVTLADVPVGTALAVGLGLAVACLLAGRDAARGVGATRAGWVIQVAAVGAGLRDPADVLPRRRSSRCCGARPTSWAARSSASGPRRTPPTRRPG